MTVRIISKSRFKPRALEYFRMVQETRQELIITERGHPVVKVVPYSEHDPLAALKELRGSVLEFRDPLEPVGEDDWEALK